MAPGLGRLALTLSFLCLVSLPVSAGPISIDFESLNELDAVGSQFGPEVTFSNAVVLSSDGLLIASEFPPHSGSKVAIDNGGPVRLDFATSISSFSGYFTYVVPLTLEFFDASSNLLGTATSLFSENYVSSGNPPNELIAGAFAGTTSVTITGSPAGGSFVMDDLLFDTTDVTPVPVPEPASLLLMGSGLILFRYRTRSERGSSKSRVRERRGPDGAARR